MDCRRAASGRLGLGRAEDSWGVGGGAAAGVEVDRVRLPSPYGCGAESGAGPSSRSGAVAAITRGGVGQVEQELVELVRPVAGGGTGTASSCLPAPGGPEDRAVFAVTPGERFDDGQADEVAVERDGWSWWALDLIDRSAPGRR